MEKQMAKTGISGFAWDAGNRQKCQRHGLPIGEIDHVLAHAETVILPNQNR
jgi:uncharacterized DUF497 family protein